MEEQGTEGAVVPPALVEDANKRIEDAVPEDRNHGDTRPTVDVTPEEMRSIIEVIAVTGKFWHDWNFLKRLLSLQLKQVLAEYPEAQMVSGEVGPQQDSLSGETYSELVNRLDEAVLRFEEGPPFTLQRLCEILLDPKGAYTKLSKLALAFEKNLLVTSTMSKCIDPYPADQEPRSGGTEITGSTDVVDVEPSRLPENPAPVSNGTEPVVGDGDEEMADAEAEDVPGSRDIEMQEDKPDQTPNANSEADSGVAITTETVDACEPSSDPCS